MSPPIRSFDPEALLENAGWVRALARRLVPSDGHPADEVRVVDADGQSVPINVFEGNSSMRIDSMQLVGGRSKVMVVGEEARTLVLLKENSEVRRVPLALVPGEVNVVRL